MTTGQQLSFTFTSRRSADELMMFVAGPDFDAAQLAEEDEGTIKTCVARYNRRVKRLQDENSQMRSERSQAKLQRAYSERGQLNLELARREHYRNSLLPPAQIGDTFEACGHTYRIIALSSLGSIDAETDDGRWYMQFTGAGYRGKNNWRRYPNGAAGEFEKTTGRKWGAGKIVVPRARSTSEKSKPAYLVPAA